MSKHDFLYEHDPDSINYLLYEHAKWNGLLENKEIGQEDNKVYTDPREFFSF